MESEFSLGSLNKKNSIYFTQIVNHKLGIKLIIH